MPKAYSYLRFSTPEQAEGDSHRRQIQQAQAYAAEHGLELDDKLTFHDLGVSAFQGRNAASGRLADFLEAVKVGLVPRGSYLLVESLDRISRQSARLALRVLEDIVDAGITVVTLADRREYTAEGLTRDPMALIMSILVFIRANEESEMKSRRLQAVWESKRQQAEEKPMTSICPSWIQMEGEEFVLIEDRAEVVRLIFRKTLEGMGVERVTRYLNETGVPRFTQGKMWYSSYVSRILRNPAVIGTHIPHRIVYKDGRQTLVKMDPIPNYYPPAVSREDYEAVQALRQKRSGKRHGRSNPTANIFGGLLVCGRCDGSMTRGTRGPRGPGERPFVVCRAAKEGVGCKYESISYDDLEKFFLMRANEIIASAPSPSGDLEEDIVQKQRQLFGVERRLAQLQSALNAEALDRAQVNALMRQVFSRAVFDFDAKELVLHWRHGGESRFEYSTAAYGFDVLHEEV